MTTQGHPRRQPPGYRPPPSAAYHRPPTAGPPRRPRSRRRWPFVVLGLVLVAVLLVGGYLALVYYRSVGASPRAEPVPEECELPAELLAEAGTPSWQSGPLRMRGGVEGVGCEWVAAADENVRKRRLLVTVDHYPSPDAAEEALVERTAKDESLVEQDAVGDKAFVRAVDGAAVLVGRRGKTLVDVQLGGSDKTFLSGLLGESEEVAAPAGRLRELTIAIGRELLDNVR